MKKWIVLLAFILIATSCTDKNKNLKKSEHHYTKPTSTGRINHVVIVATPDIWKSKAGEALKNVIQKPVKGLPQEEHQLDVSTIPPKAFQKMFQKSRNLLVLQLANKVVFKVSKNKYAQPQTILEVKAPTIAALVALINEKSLKIVNVFKQEDIKSIQKQHVKNSYAQKINTFSYLGVKMTVPKKYRMVIDTLGAFMWMRSRIAGGLALGDQTNNILVYEAPMLDKTKPILAQIVKNRDSIGKTFVRGNNVDKMYMITEKARKPSIKQLVIDNKKAYETRGTWEVFGAFNAGPFVNYTIVDEKNNRVIVAEGFNYAPSVNKRDFVFELEAILKTIKID